ncbi:NUDIX hydrolase domain-like protein, partial [Coniella lustricola]
QWAFPGGHLEHGESILECAERETLEETALRVKALRIMHVTNDVFVELGKHYVTLFVLCELVGMEDEQHEQQQPQVCGLFFSHGDPGG